MYDRAKVGGIIPSDRVRTSFLQRIPTANKNFRYLAPLYPRAFESFDLSGYDTIVSSTTAWAKGVIVPPGAVHICYINTVSRFLFDYDRYVGAMNGAGIARVLGRPVVQRLVEWDRRAAQRPTLFVANSANVAARIKHFYNRDSVVLHCPVDVDRFTVGSGDGDYYMIASRLLPYKRIDLAIRAAQLAGAPLFVAGTGPAEESLRELARGTTTHMLGFIPDAQLNELLGNARAAILPGEEDFGLVPLEAAAAGRPTIAYRAGGACETIVDGVTGEFFNEATPQSLADALRAFDATKYDPQTLRTHAEKFAPDAFIRKLKELVATARA